MNPHTSTSLTMTALLLLTSMQAAAQYQVQQQGNALDANLGIGTGGFNQAVPQENYEVRNLLVTGNVAGGGYFRGSVGYQAETDFRGVVGSDSIYQFRRDSAFSSLTGLGALSRGRSASGIAYGEAVGLLEYRRDAVGATPGTLGAEQFRREGFIFDQGWVLDDFTRTGTTESFFENRSRPRPFSVVRDEEGQTFQVFADELRGINYVPTNDPATALSSMHNAELARLLQDASQGKMTVAPGQRLPLSFENLLPAGMTELLSADTQAGAERPGREHLLDLAQDTGLMNEAQQASLIDSKASLSAVRQVAGADYASILESIARRYSDRTNLNYSIDKSLLNTLDEEYGDLKKHLLGLGKPEEDADIPDEQDELDAIIEGLTRMPGDVDATNAIDDLTRMPGMPGMSSQDTSTTPNQRTPGSTTGLPSLNDITGRGRDAESDEEAEIPPSFLPADVNERLARNPQFNTRMDSTPGRLKDFSIALRHGQVVEHYADPGTDAFSELIISGEEKLAAGEFFVAESRFRRALRLRTGHPLAQVAVAHAQLGAGMYHSSATTLIAVLRRNPELIDVRYAERIFPNRVQLEDAIQMLKKHVSDERDQAEYGFLIAYIGHQRNDAALIEAGLDQYQQAMPTDPLGEMLRSLWIGPDEQSPDTPVEAEPNK